MKTIQLGGKFYNFDLVYSIDPDYKQLSELKGNNFVPIEQYRAFARIWQVGKDRASFERLSDEIFKTDSEAIKHAQELIKQALTNSNL